MAIIILLMEGVYSNWCKEVKSELFPDPALQDKQYKVSTPKSAF